jgi:carbon-monoxide dehydrogenase medium subunit
MVGVATLVDLNGNNTCQDARIVLFGVGERPERMERAEQLLRGKEVRGALLTEVAGAVSAQLDPVSDVHASAEYRKEVGGVLTRRALESAFKRAQKALS